MSDALYHARIVEHDRSPRNEGPLDGATHAATLDNPLCGDIVTMRAIVTKDAPETVRVVGKDDAAKDEAAKDDAAKDDAAKDEAARVIAARFEMRGCALCRAAASMLTEHVIGKRVDDARALIARFETFIAPTSPTSPIPIDTVDANDAALGDLVAFRGVQTIRARRTCVTLPFRALAKALAGPSA